jgi:hypothetical protein
MTHAKNMKVLNAAIYDAIRSGNREGQPVTALREMAADIDHLIDHGCTRAEMRERIKAKRQIEAAE